MEFLSRVVDLRRGGRAKERVKRIERELRRMHSCIEYIESSDGISRWEAWLESAGRVRRDAADQITTFIQKTSKGVLPFSFLFNFMEGCKLDKALRNIEQRLNDLSNDWLERSESEHVIPFHQRERGTLLDELDAVLRSERWILSRVQPDDIEQMRDGLARIFDLVQEIEPLKEEEKQLLDKRKKAWLKEIEAITNSVHTLLERPAEHRNKFGRQINARILEACEAYNRYGIGPEFEAVSVKQGPSYISVMRPVTNQKTTPFTEVKKFLTDAFCCRDHQFVHDILKACHLACCGGEHLNETIPQNVEEVEIDAIERDLRLMKTFFQDVEEMEDLNAEERLKVWKEEMKGIAKHADALPKHVDAIRTQKEAVTSEQHGNIVRQLKRIKNEIHELSQLKKTYDIGGTKGGKRRSEPRAQGLPPESGSSIISESTLGISDVAGTSGREQETMLDEQGMRTNILADPVDPIQREVKLIHAFCKDVDKMEETDAIWVEEMKAVARAAKDVIHPNVADNQQGKIAIFERYKVAKKVNRIKNLIYATTTWKETYDIGGIKRRKDPHSGIQNLQATRPSTSGTSSNLEEPLLVSPNQTSEIRQVTGWHLSNEVTELRFPNPENGLAELVELITGELKLMHAFSEAVKAMGDVDEKVIVWVEEMGDVADDAKGVIGTCASNEKKIGRRLQKYFCMLDVFGTQSKSVAKDIRRIWENIRALYERRVAYGIEHIRRKEEPRSMENRPPSSSEANKSNDGIIGFDEDIKALINWLLTEKISSYFPIIGVGGSGKTTLAKLIYTNDIIQDHFKGRVWVSDKESTPNALRKTMEKQLMGLRKLTGKEKKLTYLIVFDNIPEKTFWFCDLGIDNLPDGGKIIYTTRAMEEVEFPNRHEMHPLSEEESWTLLQHTLNREISNPHMIKLGKEIASICQGLPGELVKRGEILSEKKRLSEWKTVLEQLIKDSVKQKLSELKTVTESLIKHHRTIEEESSNLQREEILSESQLEWKTELEQLIKDELLIKDYQTRQEESRHNLKREDILWMKRRLSKFETLLEQFNKESSNLKKDLPMYLRPYLFYFLLFPIDYEIPVRRLIALWVADGIVHQKEVENEPAEFVAERHLTELIERNLVQVTKKKPAGKVKACRLPHESQQFWLSEANKVGFMRWPSSRSSNSSSGERRLVDVPNEEDVSSSHIHGNDRNVFSSSFKSCYEDVLSFHSFDTGEGSKPGQDIQNFIRRCISDRCFHRVRVLDLEHVFRPKLPNAVRLLTSLRYLGLRWTYLQELPPYVGHLLNLQVLDLKHTYISNLPKSIWKMQYLRHLYMSETYHSKFDRPPSGHSLTELQTLCGAFVDEKSPVKNGLDRSLDIKKLGLTCRMTSPGQHEQMSSQLDAIANWIRQIKHLRTLILKSYDENGRPGDLHLKHLLSHIDLSSIYLLGKLGDSSLISRIPESLVEITFSASGLTLDPMKALGKLPKLKILRLLAESYVGICMNCSSGSFPRLQVLKLWKLRQLKHWDAKKGALPTLQDLEIRYCENLEMLPDEFRHLRTLQVLTLGNMPNDFAERIMKKQPQVWYTIAHTLKIDNELSSSEVPVEQH